MSVLTFIRRIAQGEGWKESADEQKGKYGATDTDDGDDDSSDDYDMIIRAGLVHRSTKPEHRTKVRTRI